MICPKISLDGVLIKMITQERLKALLHYDHETGVFTWIMSRPGVKAGTVAGCVHDIKGKSYNRIRINRKLIGAHRLAWLYAYGEFPEPEIDHKDGNGQNNALSNLRCVSHKENMKNMRRTSSNTSGATGVSLDKARDSWVACISVGGKNKRIGGFKNIDDAISARESANAEHRYHANHGQDRPL